MALCFLLAVPSLSVCGEKANAEELKIIRIGTHAQNEDDPTWVDSVTGEPYMDPDKKEAAETALKKVEEELNVKIQFLQYSSDVQQVLLQTVLAGDPYCELAILWGGVQGAILYQNILQPLDKYADIFLDDPDGQWILPAKTFGHYYLMNRDLLYCSTWPIVYNINMIEEAGLDYPSKLYYEGKWTWSTFEDYMAKLKTYYEGKKSLTFKDIVPFNTNYTYFGQYALHSVGACVYDGESLKFDSEAGIKACEYVDRLITKDLVSCSTASSERADSGWTTASDAFMNGETVFTNIARWRMNTAASILADRGESMGVIPFPYPDGTDSTNENYAHLSPMSDSVGLLKGIDEETSRLALEAYKMYKVEYYKALGHADSIAEYMDNQAAVDALAFGLDIFHPEVGEDNLNIWKEFGAEPANEFSEACEVMWAWSDIFGKSIYGVQGMPKYKIAIDSNKQTMYDHINTISNAVNSDSASEWAKADIEKAVAGGYIPSSFLTDWKKSVTRSEFTQTAADFLSLEPKSASPFSDTSDPHIAACYEAGIVTGVGDNKFDPSGNITRQEAAAMLFRTAKYMGLNTSDSQPSGFKDNNLIAPWAAESVDFVKSAGIMEGDESGNFNPLDEYTAEETAVTFVRLSSLKQ